MRNAACASAYTLTVTVDIVFMCGVTVVHKPSKIIIGSCSAGPLAHRALAAAHTATLLLVILNRSRDTATAYWEHTATQVRRCSIIWICDIVT